MDFIITYILSHYLPLLLLAGSVLAFSLPYLLVPLIYKLRNIPPPEQKIKGGLKALMGTGAAIFSIPMTGLLILGSLFIFGGNNTDFDDTRAFFYEHEAKYQALVVHLQEKHYQYENGEYTFPNDFKPLYAEGLSQSAEDGKLIEFMPLNFYSVLVYSESKARVEESDLVRYDSSRFVQLTDHWFLVGRDWN